MGLVVSKTDGFLSLHTASIESKRRKSIESKRRIVYSKCESVNLRQNPMTIREAISIGVQF